MSWLLSQLVPSSPSPTHVRRFVYYIFVSIPALHIGSLNFSTIEFNFPSSIQYLSLSLSPTKDFFNSVSSVWAQFVQQKRGVYLFCSISTTECGGWGVEERKDVCVCVCVCVCLRVCERDLKKKRHQILRAKEKQREMSELHTLGNELFTSRQKK